MAHTTSIARFWLTVLDLWMNPKQMVLFLDRYLEKTFWQVNIWVLSTEKKKGYNTYLNDTKFSEDAFCD